MPSERVRRHIDRLLDEADEAVANDAWATVQARAQKVVTFDPDNQDAQDFLAAAERGLSGSEQEPPASPRPPAQPTPVDAPTSFAGGRYEVKRFLGEGGKKKVYLAHDTLLDREVAFALIKTEGLDDAGRTRIQREAQAMGRLGSHPHAVTVFDLARRTIAEGHLESVFMVETGGSDVRKLTGTLTVSMLSF